MHRIRTVRASPLIKGRLAPRRFESSHSGTGAGAGAHHDPHHHHAPEPVNEHFGKGFFITLTLIPLSLALYKYSTTTSSADGIVDGTQPHASFITRLIDRYSNYQDKWAMRNALHTKMVEQAARDRNLLLNSTGSHAVELRFPEVLNTGSPYNVVAGWGSGNIDGVIEKYERERREHEEKILERLAKRRAEEEEERARRKALKEAAKNPS